MSIMKRKQSKLDIMNMMGDAADKKSKESVRKEAVDEGESMPMEKAEKKVSLPSKKKK